MGRGRGRRGRRRAPSNSDDDEAADGVESDEEGSPIPSGSSTSRPPREEEVDTSDPVIAGLRSSMDNLLQLVKDIIPTCHTDEKRAEVVIRMKTCMLKLIKSEVNYVEGLKMVDRTAETISDIEEDADDHAILGHCERLKTTALEKVTAHRNSLKDAQLMKHTFFVRLIKDLEATQRIMELKDAHQEEDSDGEGTVVSVGENVSIADLENDDEAACEMIPVTDPITKLPLTDPIRNKYCKHIYGKASIITVIQNGRTRCPTVGCSNKRWVTENHLAEDPELTLKVQRKVKEANKAKAQSTQREHHYV